MSNPHDASSLVELLRLRAATDPDRIAYTFLQNGEVEEGHVTYGELDLRARAVAARLQALGARGERALLLYPPGLEYVAALFGCFYAGVVAVPAYPPRRNKTDPRLQAIVADCGPALALTTRELLDESERLCAHTPELGGLRWLATGDVPLDEAGGWRDPEAAGDTLAFLQYTSGSTASPKGVMVSHGNLLHNFAVIEQLAGYTPQTRSVIWLPPYHDMGLIGGILQPLFTGYWAALFSPVAFIQRPARWLEAVSRYRATSSGGPNFAYELCVHAVRPEEREGLDLSWWEIAFNGAEPVRAETLRAFAESFAPNGFRARAFYPCYGLAEATLMVTGSRPAELPVERAVDPEALGGGAVVADADPEGRYRLVGSGRSAASQRVLIVDPATLRECAPDRVGEIWVAGASVAHGYWGRAEETAETFGAFEGATGEGPFLRTGDLGFLDGGELFVTGRLKDLVVIRGRNHYPQDVEMTAARSHEGLRAGSSAAFSVDQDGEERLVVVQEVSRQAAAGLDVEEVADAIRRAVAGEHGVQVHAVAVVKPGGVPKTTSGKVQRRACRAAFLAGELPLVGVSVREDTRGTAPRPEAAGLTREGLEAAAAEDRQALLEGLLVERAAQVLGMDPARVDREQPLVALGMDSLRAMELKGALEAGLGTPVPVSSLLDDTRIDRLAAELLQSMFLAEAAAPAPVEAAGDERPLSFAQERLWFLDRLQPGSAAYNLSGALRLRGEVDAGALRRALEEIVRRHDTLRTVFAEAGGRPVQRVLAAAAVPLAEVDLSELDPAEREEAARRVAAEAGRVPFDLETGPLFRARLLRLAADEHLLVMGMHHIVSDGWSAGVLIRELGALYPALLAGEESPLPPLPAQYGDWALRQRAALHGRASDEQLAWWIERLAGLPALDLPTDRARPPVQSFRGATHRFEVPAEVMEGVRALARAGGATPFMALLAAWDLLLSRYAGQADVAVGTTVSNRDRPEVAGLVGLFVNTLVLRVEVAPREGFRALLARARAAALEAFTRQDVPFERLVEELHPDRDLSRNPLFQVMLAPQSATLEPVEVPGATLYPEPLDGGAAILDLTLYTWERVGGGMSAALEYATDLFEPATVERMAAHLVQVLRAAPADPDLAVAEVPLLLPAERAQLLGEWNATGRPYAERPLHELFAEQAARTPDAAAVRFGGHATTYAELARSANRLAHHLRALGVGPESRVGLCAERTPDLLAAMLGILGAGGAYVPLDPAYPAERLEYMLEDSGAAVVVSQAHLAERLPAGVARVLVDADAERIAARPDTAPESGADAGSLAYVLYTSGSTGRPKGVQVEHRSASQIVHFLRDAVRAEDRAAVLGATSVSFDVSVGEIFGTISWGGTLVLVESVLELPRVAHEGVRLVVGVPSALAELLRSGGIPASVRALNLAGEALPAPLARELYALPHVERVLNMYGPTEDTVYSTWSEVERGAERVRIGRPVANSRAYVLDPAGSPAPVGVAGELCLGGAGVARGYHARPGLTADRFVPDPFGGEPGARLYRTGDRARWLAGGELEYLGRIDQQVKVRGFRIEPGEVESALLEHPGVGDAVVVARPDAGGVRLAAYHLPAEGADRPTAAELRAWLRGRLPDYMVPADFVALDAFPLTPSGKTDRRALPEPRAEATAEAEPARPATPTEEILAGIFAAVLGVERVGVHDDFFALGGHSLLGARVVSRIRLAFEVELPLRALFEAPTIAALAGRVEALRSDGSALVAPPVERAGREGPLPLSYAQQRLWVVDQLDPGSPAYNMPLALRLRGALDAAALRAGIAGLVRRHEALRTTFREQDGAPVQVVHPAADVELPVLDLRGVPEEEREAEARRLADEEALRPFDLARGPLLRGTLLRLGERDHVLCFTVHHVVADGWSTEIMVRELSALYGALREGRPAELPELPVQYADYAVWQREWLGGETLEAQVGYWRERLEGAPPLLEVLTDRPRTVVQDAGAGSHALALSPEVARRLRALSGREGVSLFMTVLAGWQALLGRYAGQDDVVVGTPVAGRTRHETEGLVGFFVNMLALRADLGGEPTWTELLGRVREETLGAYAHQDLPFERLVDELGVERSLTHTPLFQAVFALHRSAPADHLALAEVEIGRFDAGAEAAKFDLDLRVTERGEGLGGTLLFREALFEAATAARMAGHLEVLLGAMAADPERRLPEVPLLLGAERAQVLARARGGQRAQVLACVHELFAEQAARTPERTAVVGPAGTLSYAELDLRSSRLAHRLRRGGVGPDVRVGVCLERDLDMAVAMLGILKAGGAYAFLDPDYPAPRLALMLEELAAPVVVSQAALRDRLPGGAEVLCLDLERERIAAEPDTAPAAGVGPEHLAYVIYTSGSTGTPKGTEVPHRAVPGFFWEVDYAWFDGEQVALQHSSTSWDVLTMELWPALLRGGRCVLYPGRSLDPEGLARQVESNGVTWLWLTAAMFNVVVDTQPEMLDGLRFVLTGGETVSGLHVQRALARNPGLRVVNGYGPSECTVFASCHVVEPGFAGAEVPIGRPIGDRRVYVLDARGEPVPTGVAGELYVGGPAVARGYLGRPALTAERFVPDPFADEPGARLYRSGDRVRWLATGELEYLGRTDAQVKVRGFRIEPGEVEAALLGLPQVREAVVVVREDAPGQKRLVGYVVPEAGAGAELSTAGLREALSGRMPEYMVPAAFVVLDRLPLNANAKVDRRALPAPEAPAAADASEGPRTEVEAALAAVWAEVLGTGRVGLDESFFDLGGDSILSIQVVSRARQRGLKLTPRQLFERPTVARLAEVVEWAGSGAAEAAQGPVAGEAPLTPVQARFFEQARPDRSHFNQALLLVPREPLDARLLGRAAAALEAHHDALRLRFARDEGGAWRQEHAGVGGRTPLTVVDLSGLAERARREAIEAAAQQAQRSLDIARGPLLRMAYFAPGAGLPGRLLAVVHHLAVDGVSWRVLLEDLEGAYAQLARGEAVRLPPKTTSWKAWAERLAGHARSGALAEEAAYWTDQSAREVRPLPVDDPRGENTEGRSRSVAVRLGEEETEALLREVPQAYRTQVDEVLLAALAGALRRWTGERRVRIDLEGHGREELFADVDLSRTVGWFTTVYPVVLELPEAEEPGAALKAVKEQLRAIPGKGIGYGMLRRLAPGDAGHGLAEAGGAEIAFNYLGQFDRAVSEEAFFAFAPESPGDSADPAGPRSHLLVVTGSVRDGRLELDVGYAEGVHRRETVERLAEWLGEELRGLIAHCTSDRAGGYTPSDFPLAPLEQAELDALLGSGRGVEDVYPLSPMQEGMLFHALYAPESGVYVGQFGFVLEGPLDADALERAWQGAVARHEALRAGFAWEGVPRPLQVIRREVQLSFVREDWREQEEAERQSRLERWLAADRAAGFELGRAPLMRLALLRMGDEAHQLVWTHHHLVLDGWSLSLIFRDVLALYASYAAGAAPQVTAARRYRDYVAWLGRQDRARAERFWRGALAGFGAPTPLPGARAQRGTEPGHGAQTLRLDAGATEALRERARRLGVTLSTLVQGAWALLLSRYAGVEDVVFGATVSGRPAELAGVEETVGLFINTLPVRVRLPGQARLGEWLAGVQREQVEAREFEYAPLVEVRRWSEVAAGEELFGSLVVYENYPVDQALAEVGRLEGLRVRYDMAHQQTNYPLGLTVDPHDGLKLHLRYERSAVDDDAARRLLDHLEVALEAVAGSPERPLHSVTLLRPAERAHLLHAWNGADTGYTGELCIHELVREQVLRAPGAPALRFREQGLGYEELFRAASRLANRLAREGVGPEVRVGICMERSPEMIVSVLGVLVAGGAYLPIDPELPAERLRYMLEDAAPALVLTQAAMAPRLDGCGVPLLCVDAEADRLAAESDRAPASGVGPDNLAYVIYTSGSTGRPKGVLVQHRGVGNTFLELGRVYGVGPGDRSLAYAPLHFDASVGDMFIALCNGAELVVARSEELLPGDDLVRLLREQRITHVKTMPSALAVTPVEPLPHLRSIGTGGEVLPAEVVRRWGAGRRFFSGYGATEASIRMAATAYTGEEGGNIPVGHPVANTQLYVLDGELEPVPVGVAGELYIGGVGVVRGYLGRPDLTAERFVPDPHRGVPGARLYRTGDVGRRRADGEVDFVGRRDHQVKVRGYRVELGEIEAVLRAHPGVREAAVLLWEDAPGRQRLVAYVGTEAGAEPAKAELQAHAAERLPEYMVPSAFVVMERLPVTTNGKTDRRALPAPEQPGGDGEYVAPRTPAEAALAEVWSEVLGVERVGVEDGFFDLGGDSILSIQVVSRARQRGLRLTPRQLFENPTVARLAGVAGWTGEEAAGPAQGPVTGEAPLTPPQHRFFEHDFAARHHFNQGLLLAPREPLAPGLLGRAVEAVAAHHDALRLRFRREADGSWRQWHAAPGERSPLAVLDLSGVAEAGRRGAVEAAAEQVQRSLELEHGPLLRMAYLHLGAGEAGRLLGVVHHLAVDAVSWRILLEDLEAAYVQLARGEAVALPAKTTSYAAWAERLAAHARSGELAAEAAYWTAGAQAAVAALPVDHAAGENRVRDARRVTVRLDEDETGALLREVPQAYRTRIDDVLLAALAAALGRWTGERRARVELEGHGREDLFADVDLSRTVGWFTSVFPVVLELPEAGGAGAALKAVKEQLRAVPNRGIGYGVLRYLGGDTAAQLGGGGQAQVGFNYLGQFDASVSGGAFFAFAPESAGAALDGATRRRYLLEVVGAVRGGRLEVEIAYAEGVHRRETVERLAGWFGEELRELIAHCTSDGAGGYTPSDFPLARLGQAELDALLGRERGVEDVFPLAPLQEGILFHALYAPESGVYVGQFGLRLEGPLDADALERAWQGAVARHEALRAAFAWEGVPRPLQVVRREVRLPFRREDWRALDEAGQQARLAAFLAADRAAGFDPGRAPLTRLALFRLGDEEHQLVWTHHHLVLDGWSLSLIFRDVLALYASYAAGAAPQVTAARRYRDYVAWLGRQDRARAERFWRGALAGFDTPTPLPGARAQRGAEPGHGAQTLRLDAGATEALRERARRLGVTLSTLVQGAWALLLSRWAGEEDVVFGATVSGRPAELAGVEETVGLFINTLPVRVRLPGQARLGEWLAGVQREQVEAREFEYAPLVEVRRWSEVAAGEELFGSLVVYENFPVDQALAEQADRLGGLRLGEIFGHQQTNYPLVLVAEVEPGAGLRAELRHERSLLDDRGAQGLLAQLGTVLDAVAGDPERRLADVSLLRGAEREQLLAASAPAAEFPRAVVHELFARQAERTPDAPAVTVEGATLAYAELDRRANRLAHVLRRRGVGPEVRVAVCAQRSAELVVALLAVLKAGGAYVPIDPAYPAERIAYLLEDSGCAAVLAQAHLLPLLGEIRAEVIALEEALADAAVAEDAPRVEVDPGNAAYVIYTSGSTGKPKGVVVTHGNVSRLFAATDHWFGFGSEDVWTLFHSYAFDFSVWEIWGALLYGGRLVVVPWQTSRDPEAFYQLLAREGVTVLNQTPSAFRQLAAVEEERGASAELALRYVIFGGEALEPRALRGWMERHGEDSPLLVNMYGITETTVHVTYRPVRWADVEAGERSPVGEAIPDLGVRVLDPWGNPVPLGVPGEMYVAGAGLARGYLGRPELTAERFVPDPFSAEPGARLYRSGDRARWLAAGELEYLGRADAQVKIRGFRIEPGEIEAALCRHPGVREVVVVVREDAPGQKRLVAYVVPEAGAEVSVPALRDGASERLPEHMVPAAFVVLDRLPLTANGKTDRRALPAPETAAAGEAFVAPRTEVEEILGAVWAEVLGVERVGVDDGFFELGGDSILSIQVVSRARQRGLKLTPRQLFERPTIARLAEVVERTGSAAAGAQEPVTGEAPLTPIQHRFFERPFPALHHFNHALLLVPREPLRPELLGPAARALEAHHDALRLRFAQDKAGAWTQSHAGVGRRTPLAVFDLSGLPDGEQRRAMEAAADQVQRSLDLARGPLLRMAYFSLGAGLAGRLLAVVHHLAVDGVSWRILLEDLESAYAQLARGEAVRLPAKSTSWQAWAGCLAEQARSEDLAREAGFWVEQARQPVAALPVDDRAAENTVAGSRSVAVQLGEEETEALLREVPQAYRTQIDEVLLTALAAALGRWTGERRLRIDLEGHGREEEAVGGADLSRTVGWFTTVYPVVLELPETGDAGAALRAVKEQLRAVPGKGIGYGMLRYLGEGGAAAELAGAADAEVAFNYLGQFDASVSAESFFAFASESPGASADGRTPRRHLLEVGGSVQGGRLELKIGYAEGVHRRETVERLAEGLAAELRELIAHCRSEEAGGFTPSDFPLVELDEATLAFLEDEFGDFAGLELDEA